MYLDFPRLFSTAARGGLRVSPGWSVSSIPTCSSLRTQPCSMPSQIRPLTWVCSSSAVVLPSAGAHPLDTHKRGCPACTLTQDPATADCDFCSASSSRHYSSSELNSIWRLKMLLHQETSLATHINTNTLYILFYLIMT